MKRETIRTHHKNGRPSACPDGLGAFCGSEASEPIEPRRLRLFRAISEGSSLVVALTGLLVLAGWRLNLDVLKRLHPALVPMKPNLAAAFVLLGAGLWLLRTHPVDGRGRRILGYGCAVLATIVGALTFSEYWIGWDSGLDRALFSTAELTQVSAAAARMAPNAALNLVVVGLALLGLESTLWRGLRPAEWLALVGATMSYFALWRSFSS